MIVPATRLLIWVALAVVPAAGLAVLLPAAPLLWLPPVGLAVVALADALGSRRRLRAVAVGGPEVTRLVKDGAEALVLHVANEGPRLPELRLAVALPTGFTTPLDLLRVRWPADAARVRVRWPCTASQRGLFRVRACALECDSALGLWAVRRAVPCDVEVRVYPNLLSERRAAPALFLRRGVFGLRAQRQIGKGKEFEQLREYLPGDGYEDIHWKATAKRGHPVTKMFQIERTQEVYIVMDTSRLSRRPAPRPGAAWSEISQLTAHSSNGAAGAAAGMEGGGGDPARPTPAAAMTTVLERYINAALLLGRAAERQGDLFGVLTFDSGLTHFTRARKGKAHYQACLDAVLHVQPRDATPDFDEVCAFIRTRLRRRALIVFLTQLDDPLLAEAFARGVEAIRAHHLVLAMMLTPGDVRPLFAEAEAARRLDDVYGLLAGHLRWQQLRALQSALRRRGVAFAWTAGESLCAHLITQYMNIKQRQRL